MTNMEKIDASSFRYSVESDTAGDVYVKMWNWVGTIGVGSAGTLELAAGRAIKNALDIADQIRKDFGDVN